MSKLIRINLGVDPDHNLADFPVNIYTGTTTGDTTNWGFTETPVITFPMVITTPFEFWVDDELLSFGIRLESGGCNNVDLLVNAPRVDCEMCMNVVPYNAPQPTSTPQPTQQPTATPIPSSTPNSTNSPTSTPTPTAAPAPTETPTPNPTATSEPTTYISAILLSSTPSDPNGANCTEDNTGIIENRVYVLYNTTWFTTVNGVNVVKSRFALTDNEIINGSGSGYTIHPNSISTATPTVFKSSPNGSYMVADESTEGSGKLLFNKDGDYGNTTKCG